LICQKGKIELKQFEPGTTIEGIVSVASNASYFFLQLIDQKKDEFDHLSKSLQYVILFSLLTFLFYSSSIVNTIQILIKIPIIIHYPVIIVLQCIQKMLDGIELVLYDIFQVYSLIFCFFFLTTFYNIDQTCEVFYIDYGNMEELPIDLVHEILPDFARIPGRAIACTIAEVKKNFF